jgi:formate-dependent nitrite reductase membrane component NrfD
MDMTIGDVFLQLFMMALLIAIVFVAFMVAKGLRNRRIQQRKQVKQVEEKLDQIIEKMDQSSRS